MTSDSLTGLPTGQALLRLLQSRRKGTVLYINIASLNFSNAVLGPMATDRLLIETVDLLKTTCPNGLVARLGGSEFVVFVESPPPERLSEVIRSAFDGRFAHHRAVIRAGTSKAGVINAPARVLTLRIGQASLADYPDADAALTAAEGSLS